MSCASRACRRLPWKLVLPVPLRGGGGLSCGAATVTQPQARVPPARRVSGLARRVSAAERAVRAPCAARWARGQFSSAAPDSLEAKIASFLKAELDAVHVDVEDTSGDGSFFSLHVVSPKFEGMTLIKQHRAVKGLLSDVFENIHGLTLRTQTPKAYEKELEHKIM